MHELSIVMNIIELAEEQAKKHQGKVVDKIELEIGTLAGIERESFDFAWRLAVRDTILEDAQCDITTVKAMARCAVCGFEFSVHNRFEPCPKCHDYLAQIIRGKELKVKSLTLT